MNIKIVLCDKNNKGDIPEFDLKSTEEADDLILHWLQNKDFLNSVFVCFQSFEELNYKNEQQAILVSHSWDDVVDFVQLNLNEMDIIEHEYFTFSIFEFMSYKDAFKYCLDLKEAC